jgi:excisionase family DNA binding protein
MDERYLSLVEACEVLGKSERTLYRWIKSGKLRAYKPGRDYEIPESAIREMRERSEVSPKAESRSSLEPSLFNGPEDERHTATIREGVHLKGYVSSCLDRWERVARGDDPHIAPDHALAIEVSQHVIDLTTWLGNLARTAKAELSPEGAASEQREIVRLIDRMGAVAAEIAAIANAAEGITAEAVDAEGAALAKATAHAIAAERAPANELARQKAERSRRVYEAISEVERSGDEAKRAAAS